MVRQDARRGQSVAEWKDRPPRHSNSLRAGVDWMGAGPGVHQEHCTQECASKNPESAVQVRIRSFSSSFYLLVECLLVTVILEQCTQGFA